MATDEEIRKLTRSDDEEDVTRLGDMDLPEVSAVDRGANRARFFIIKDESGDVPVLAEELMRVGKEYITKADEPTDGMTLDELREARANRADRFGIEVLEGDASNLRFPKDRPKDLRFYADPVNLKYPVETPERARNARARFKQNFGEYEKDKSRNIVHERIVRAQIDHGVSPGYDEKDKLDRALPASLREKMGKGDTGTAKAANLAAGSKDKLVSAIQAVEKRRAALESRISDAVEDSSDTMPIPINQEIRGLAAQVRGVSSQYPEFKSGSSAVPSDSPVTVHLSEKNKAKLMTSMGKVKGQLAKALAAAQGATEGEESGDQIPKEIGDPMAQAATELDAVKNDIPVAAGEGAKPAEKQEEEEKKPEEMEGSAGKQDDSAGKQEPPPPDEENNAAAKQEENGDGDGDGDKPKEEAAGKQEEESDEDKPKDDAAGKQEEEEEQEPIEDSAGKSDDTMKTVGEAVKMLAVALGKLKPGQEADEAVVQDIGKVKEMLDAHVGKSREKSEKVAKAGAKMAAKNRKQLMGALESLAQMATELIPETERAKGAIAWSDSEKRTKAKKSDESKELESTKAELEKANAEVVKLRKSIKANERAAPPSNVADIEKPSVQKSDDEEDEGWNGIPFDANDMSD